MNITYNPGVIWKEQPAALFESDRREARLPYLELTDEPAFSARAYVGEDRDLVVYRIRMAHVWDVQERALDVSDLRGRCITPSRSGIKRLTDLSESDISAVAEELARSILQRVPSAAASKEEQQLAGVVEKGLYEFRKKESELLR